jgi:dihydrofolate reductase
MSKVVVLNHLTLDGVMQAPGRPDEDRRGGFAHGGWARPRGDSVAEAFGGVGEVGGLLLGRRTYEDFFSFWPHQTNNPFTAVLNSTQKYVASTTLAEPLPWSNSTLLTGDAAAAVAALKQQLDKDLLIMGSGELIRSLMRHNLVDKYVLLIHPLVLGTGQRLFAEGSPATLLQLADTKTTASGVVIATYRAPELLGPTTEGGAPDAAVSA